MKIVTVIMQNDYGVQSRGNSFEYTNIYLPLCQLLGKDNVLLYDFMEEKKKEGHDAMNQKLRMLVDIEKPDITLFCLFEKEIDVRTITEIRRNSKTVVYFFDDPWRQSFVRHWIQHFDYFTTSDYYMLQQYQFEGIKNVIYTPFGFNPSVYVKKDIAKIYDVSFVGGFSPLRKYIIDLLAKEGIKVNVFGRGWGNDAKFVTLDEMINIFNQSRINLNLSNGTSQDLGMLLHSLRNPKAIKYNLLNKKIKEQVKGRHFEINACGGFQLSYFIPGLNLFYEIDKEIACYEDIYNLPAEIKFFLKNHELRHKIADAGYERSIKDHSAEKYLSQMLKQIIEG